MARFGIRNAERGGCGERAWRRGREWRAWVVERRDRERENLPSRSCSRARLGLASFHSDAWSHPMHGVMHKINQISVGSFRNGTVDANGWWIGGLVCATPSPCCRRVLSSCSLLPLFSPSHACYCPGTRPPRVTSIPMGRPGTLSIKKYSLSRRSVAWRQLSGRWRGSLRRAVAVSGRRGTQSAGVC